MGNIVFAFLIERGGVEGRISVHVTEKNRFKMCVLRRLLILLSLNMPGGGFLNIIEILHNPPLAHMLRPLGCQVQLRISVNLLVISPH